jgi:hypothetical protein
LVVVVVVLIKTHYSKPKGLEEEEKKDFFY